MGQGDFKEEEFTDEEKAALGEAAPAKVDPPAPDAEKDEHEEGPEPEAKPEGEVAPEEKPEAEQEQTETEIQAEEMGLEVVTDEKTGKQYIVDEDGARIPPKRFREVYREAKEGERTKEKLDLFKKLGPEGYYQAYPDERPASAPEKTPDVPLDVDPWSLTVKQPDGPYDGMALRDVFNQGGDAAIFAMNLRDQFMDSQRQKIAEKAGEESRLRQAAATEIETFATDIAREMFGKEPSAVTKEEEAQIGETIKAVTDWMLKTHRGGGVIADAYFLMSKEGILKKVSEAAAQRALKSITDRKGPASIDTGKGGEPKETGFEAYEKMTEEALTAKIDAMTDKDTAKFFKEAPDSLRKKYPSLPWTKKG